MLETLPVSVIKGVGPETVRDLESLNIITVGDLLEHFPYRYDNYQPKDLAQAAHGEKITIIGKVHSEPSLRFYSKKKSRLSFRVFSGNYLITAVVFNRGFLKKRLSEGTQVLLVGKWDAYNATLTASEIQLNPSEKRTVEPVYSVRGDLTVKGLRKIIRNALDYVSENPTNDLLPEALRKKYKIPERLQALRQLHFPTDRQSLKHARRRMVYEELLLFQLKLQILKTRHRQLGSGVAKNFDPKIMERFINALPFSLTKAQERVVDEILTDLKSPFRMNRLLQGDVGSGKTVVCAIGLFAAVQAGFQGALMAPTEILAEQHAEQLSKLFQPFDVKVALLTGAVKGKERRKRLQDLENGDIDVVIGTHALIQEVVRFSNLGLVVTDEQHRFGVEQRRALRSKGEQTDVLFMTATPIPRTLAIAAFGDMDVSTIDEMPSGRKKIKTAWVKHDRLEAVLTFIRKELKAGRQAYVICPLIEESEQLDVQNAIDVHNYLTQFFKEFHVGLLHGRMSGEEKEAVMTAFKSGDIHVLVSTTVVEVGVNVPNATVMVIYDAERFGLAQLHQLRGRVGRGDAQSYCILIADGKSETARERMRIMTETTDGFKLSEYDLKLRGPGDFFGYKQSGLPDFKIADLIHDYRALEVARRDAGEMVSSKAFWEAPEYEGLRERLERDGLLESERFD
ncbi:ATP-dependent DNA helicase RecG [Tuberibacillus calidus]|uniref:ATP-dependent DNA helicase RecG n=1 Tax=Tuberibacillus calidus TaxID=340097 RepID=UPI0004243ED9|nr:ATP-dependent DNA helicase RecG [Tuberibacillus calidus]